MGGRDPVPLGRVVRSVQVCNIGFYILPPSFRSFWRRVVRSVQFFPVTLIISVCVRNYYSLFSLCFRTRMKILLNGLSSLCTLRTPLSLFSLFSVLFPPRGTLFVCECVCSVLAD